MKNLYIFILIALQSFNNAYAQDSYRWRILDKQGEIKWDTQSAKKINNEKVRFFYEYPYLEEQRNYLVKNKILTRLEANSVLYGRMGVIANCKTMEYGIFHSTQLNSNRTPIAPPTSIPINEVIFEFIMPDTEIELFVEDVCRYFKIK